MGLMKTASKFRLVMNNELGVIWKEATWPNLRYCYGVSPEGRRDVMKNFNQKSWFAERNLNSGHPEYKIVQLQASSQRESLLYCQPDKRWCEFHIYWVSVYSPVYSLCVSYSKIITEILFGQYTFTEPLDSWAIFLFYEIIVSLLSFKM
jgi:hypothetical protein